MNRFVDGINRLNTRLGQAVAWALLAMVFITFLTVILRYFFKLGWVWLQEVVVYLHAALFLLAAGWALLKEAHVRVDVFYREASPHWKRKINLLGALFLLFPTVIVLLVTAFPFVMDSWSVWEGSKDGGGLEAVFLLKSLILLFGISLGAGALSLFWASYREKE